MNDPASDEIYKKTLTTLELFGWTVMGAIIIASILISHLLDYASPWSFISGTGSILFIPLACGFVLGIIAGKHKLEVVIYATIFMVILSVLIILLVLSSPIILGIASSFGYFSAWVIQKMALSFIMVFPTTLVSAIIGKAIGERYSKEFLIERELLQRETKEWHDMLRTIGAEYLRRRKEEDLKDIENKKS